MKFPFKLLAQYAFKPRELVKFEKTIHFTNKKYLSIKKFNSINQNLD